MPGSVKGEPTPALWRVEVGDFPRAIGWSSTGEEIAVGTAAGTVQIRRARDGSLASRYAPHDAAVTTLAWHPREPRLATAGEDGAVRILEVGSERVLTLVAPDGSWADLVAWNPKGSKLAVAKGRQVVIFASDGRELVRLPEVESTVAGLSWSPDGETVACACYGGVRLFDPKSARKLRELDWKGSMISLAWSPSGKVIACGCQDNSVHFWRLPKGKDSMMSGYPAKPKAIGWSGNGKLLATSGGAEATVWNFTGEGPEGKPPIQLAGHPSPITAVTFAPMVSLLATACRDGVVHLWAPEEHDRPVGLYRLDARIESLAWGTTIQGQRLLLAGTDSDGSLAVWPVV